MPSTAVGLDYAREQVLKDSCPYGACIVGGQICAVGSSPDLQS